MSMKAIYAANNSRAANRYSHHYVGVDKRCYKTEADARELKLRGKVIRNGIANDRVSASDIIKCEAFLANGCVPDKSCSVTQARREQTVAEYDLYHEGADSRWLGDEQHIFDILCEKFPFAREQFRSYKDIKYAMKYYDPRNGAVKVVVEPKN